MLIKNRKFAYFIVLNTEQFYSAGGHIAHRFNDWKPSAFGIRNFCFVRGGFLIYNLVYTIFFVQKAFLFLKQMSLRGSIFLYVESDKFSISVIKSAAIFANISYITNLWIGGILTNFKETVYRLLKRRFGNNASISNRLKRYAFGLSKLDFIPEVIVCASEFHSPFSIQEANKLLLPSVSVVDSNLKFIESTYPVILNDDSFIATKLLFFIFSSGYWFGRADFAVRHLNISLFFILSLVLKNYLIKEFNSGGLLFERTIQNWIEQLKSRFFVLPLNLFNSLFYS